MSSVADSLVIRFVLLPFMVVGQCVVSDATNLWPPFQQHNNDANDEGEQKCYGRENDDINHVYKVDFEIRLWMKWMAAITALWTVIKCHFRVFVDVAIRRILRLAVIDCRRDRNLSVLVVADDKRPLDAQRPAVNWV